MSMKKKINLFWEWFASIANLLAPNFENETLLEEIDYKVSSLGNFSWEIGPGKVKDNSFTLSPNGNVELLKEAKYILSLSPIIDNWELHFAKQRKEWDFIFHLKQNNIEKPFDAKKWKYVLFEFDDKTFDIIIESPDLMVLNEDDRYYAVQIALDGALGEEDRINKIKNIEIVTNAAAYKSQLSKFENLFDHFTSISK